jgi:cysteinyl-tRNA synthetase
MDYSREALASAAAALRRLRHRMGAQIRPVTIQTYADAMNSVESDVGRAAIRRIDEAITDDLNTARVLASLQEALQTDIPGQDRAVLVAAAERILGLGLFDQAESPAMSTNLTSEVQSLLADRDTARRNRDWSEADRIRDELQRMGVRIQDTPSGTQWELI